MFVACSATKLVVVGCSFAITFFFVCASRLEFRFTTSTRGRCHRKHDLQICWCIILNGSLENWTSVINFKLGVTYSKHQHQCPRLKPSYEFHFEGLSNTKPQSWRVDQIQDVNLRIIKRNTKLILNMCMHYIVHVSNIMWRITNLNSSNSTSCSDKAICLLVLVVAKLYWRLQVTASFSIWGCVLKGYFERSIFWRA